jgi:NAD+ diphosphatase
LTTDHALSVNPVKAAQRRAPDYHCHRMPFTRIYPNGAPLPEAGIWFLLHKGGLVLSHSNGELGMPSGALRRDEWGFDGDILHLGHIDGVPCLVTELHSDADLPGGHRTLNLRELYGRIADEHYAVAGYATQMALWHRNSRYCMRCGQPLQALASEWGKRCSDPACGWTMYPPVNPCTITLVHDGERVLLTHKDGWGPRFGLVAGFVEPGESFEDSLRREVAEEVGVSVGAIEYFRSPYPHQIMVGFLAEYAGGDVMIDTTELDEARWFHIDALPVIPPPLSIARQLINAWAARHGRDTTALG